MNADSTAVKDESPQGLSHRAIMTILSGLLMGMFLAALDQTIVSTAIRTIADDLQGYSLQAWVTTAYLITATIVTPLYGKLSDMYGRKPFYMIAISLFIIGSLLCSTATSMYQLAGYRALQGLGAGGLMSLALTIIGDIVPPRERAKYQAYFMAVFGTSSVLGPVLGGLFAGQDSLLWVSGWRWVFLVNVPVGLVALVVVFRVLNYDQVKSTRTRVDWLGAGSLALGAVPLLIVAEQGREWGWGSVNSISCYLIGIIGIILFIVVEYKMGDAAIIPLRIFRSRVFSQGVVISFVVGAVMFGALSMLPQYYQVLRDASPTQSGLQMLPMVLGLMLGSITVGRIISRTGHYRIYPIIGSVLITLGAFLLHFVSVDTSIGVVMVLAFLVGLGLGNLMQPLVLAMQNAAPPKDMGVSTAAATFFRQIGGTMGVAVFFSVLFSLVGPNIQDEMTQASTTPEFKTAVVQSAQSNDPAVREFGQALANPNGAHTDGVLNDTSVIAKLPEPLAHPIKVGFADAMDMVFLSVSILAILAIVLTLFWKEIPLRTVSGASAARADADAAKQS